MAYTTPPTFSAGAILTASQMNTYLRDNFKALGDAWASFGSGANWTAATTNPTLGNGTWDGKWIKVGKLVVFEIVITAGSTTTYGSGTYNITLPTAPLRSSSRQLIQGSAFDSSASSSFPMWGMVISGALRLSALPTTAGNALAAVTPTVPFTFANGDQIEVAGVYEAA